MIFDTPSNLFVTALEPLFKAGFIIFALLYFFFSIIVVRQVALMTETVVTEIGPVLKFLSIIYALLSLGALIFFIVMF